MPKILTVDDSRAVRMIVTKHASSLGFTVDEAEDGEQGLLKLAHNKFDLIVLDVTMPNLDGPGMVAKMRERGDHTPVLMLTSESKRSIVAGLLKLGISDYILKPFKPEELSAKILKALKMEALPGTPTAATSAAAAPSQPGVDILVVDDMENVHKRLRTMLPEAVTSAAATSGQAALATCRERPVKVFLVDNEMPDVNSAALMKQMRILQPNAKYLLLALRSNNDLATEAKDNGFDGVMFKPFTSESLEEFLLKYFDNQEVVSAKDNVLRLAPFRGKENRLPGYFVQVASMASKSMDDLAAACFADVIVDLTNMPSIQDKAVRLVIDLDERAKQVGVELKLVGTKEVAKVLSQYAETASVPMFTDVAAAQGGG